MKCNQICKWNSNVGCVKPYGVTCKLENVPSTDKKATNADRIRTMNDKELADVVANGVGCVLKAPHCMDVDCTPCIRKWLQQPAEGE